MDDAAFDIRSLSLDADPQLRQRMTAAAKKRRPPTRMRGWFFAGPIPGDWIRRATALNAAAIRVALAIWHEAALEKSRTVVISAKTRQRFSIRRVDRGLAALERGGLVRVNRHQGRLPRITIVETPPS